MGLYVGEYVVVIEFVFGVMFVVFGVIMIDILLGLFIGNLLVVLSWILIIMFIVVEIWLSLYIYL